MSDSAASPAAATGAAAPPAVILTTFSNEHLLKYDCQDKYSTAANVKKHVQKMMNLTAAPGEPIFRGLTRVGKNPSSSIVYFGFDSEENKAAAKAVLANVVYRPSKPWKELAISDADLKVTHRGAGRTAESGAETENDNKKNRNNADAAAASGGERRPRKDENDGGDDDDDNNGGGGEKNSNNLAPWGHLDYDTQIERKADHCKRVLKVIARYHHTAPGSQGAQQVAALRNGTCFEGVLHSPDKFGYRNNVQLSAGLSAQGVPMFGFNAGALVDGQAAVLPASAGRLTSHPAVEPLAQILHERVIAPLMVPGVFRDVEIAAVDSAAPASSSSSPPTFDPATSVLTMYDKMPNKMCGFWRRVQFRFNAEGHCMIDIEVKEAGVPPEILGFVRQRLVKCFASEDGTSGLRVPYRYVPPPAAGAGGGSAVSASAAAQQQQQQQQGFSGVATIQSLQWHFYSGHSVGGSEIPRETLFGTSTLKERLGGLSFDVAPTDFFQVSRAAMELLIARIKTAATLDKQRTTLLDLCSGTGTLGLVFADSVRQVIGIELVATAVENANRNAVHNQITNARFICGKVEEQLPRVLRGMHADELQDVVAILDPPRCGVNATVLKALRNAVPGLRTIVYISCDQRSLESNCEPLCKSSSTNFFGLPFGVHKSFGVDLFPHTHHVEMIAIMKRMDSPPAAAAASAAAAETATGTATTEDSGTSNKNTNGDDDDDDDA